MRSFLSRDVIRTRAQLRARELDRAQLSATALFVAPHPDDEVLGCGGTIARKLEAGAVVRVAFVTDGGGSHPGADPDALGRRRRREAREAMRRLGLAAEQLSFFGLRDGGVAAHRDACAQRIGDELRRFPAQQLFMPYLHDRHPDHLAVNRAARLAQHTSAAPPRLFEYPVWFWNDWPWVGHPERGTESNPGSIGRALLSLARSARDLRLGVDVSQVAAKKRHALAAYETQLVRQERRWWTLGDVSDGEFLERALRARELFCPRG